MRPNFKEVVWNVVAALVVVVLTFIALVLNHRNAVREFERYGDAGTAGSVIALIFLFLGGAFVLYFLLKAVSFLLKEARESRREL